MGVNITIEGSTTPATGVLKKGQRKTVQLTDRIQRLLDRGFVVEVSRTEIVDHDADAPDYGADDSSSDGTKPDSKTWQPTPPGANAGRETWAKFLSELDPPVAFPEDASRAQLKHIYQEVVGGS